MTHQVKKEALDMEPTFRKIQPIVSGLRVRLPQGLPGPGKDPWWAVPYPQSSGSGLNCIPSISMLES